MLTSVVKTYLLALGYAQYNFNYKELPSVLFSAEIFYVCLAIGVGS